MERYLGRRKWIDLGEEMTRNPHRLIHETLSELLQVEILKGSRHGAFHSAHELASVLREEYEEFWDSTKADNPDPGELLQVASVALRGIHDLCTGAARTSALDFRAKEADPGLDAPGRPLSFKDDNKPEPEIEILEGRYQLEAKAEIELLAAKLTRLRVVRTGGDRNVELSYDGSLVTIEYAEDPPEVRINGQACGSAETIKIAAERGEL